jgi:tetratricopeptide (TPR) repeat protein
MLREPGYLLNQGKYDAALEVLGKQNNLDKLPISVQAKILRIYGQIYAGAGQEKEASAKFKEALELEEK